jgi:hypothetical protein
MGAPAGLMLGSAHHEIDLTAATGTSAYPALTISSIRLASLFLTLPTRVRTGQHPMHSDG